MIVISLSLFSRLGLLVLADLTGVVVVVAASLLEDIRDAAGSTAATLPRRPRFRCFRGWSPVAQSPPHRHLPLEGRDVAVWQ